MVDLYVSISMMYNSTTRGLPQSPTVLLDILVEVSFTVFVLLHDVTDPISTCVKLCFWNTDPQQIRLSTPRQLPCRRMYSTDWTVCMTGVQHTARCRKTAMDVVKRSMERRPWGIEEDVRQIGRYIEQIRSNKVDTGLSPSWLMCCNRKTMLLLESELDMCGYFRCITFRSSPFSGLEEVAIKC
jgi:hypothetical protein